jgi:serine/threonine-protein kinase ULK/ATG1
VFDFCVHGDLDKFIEKYFKDSNTGSSVVPERITQQIVY